jgi:two-component system, OmpR family, sensor histidine kinase KdpD
MRGPWERRETVRVLSSLRARLTLRSNRTSRDVRTLVDAAERLAAGDVRSRSGLDRNTGGELGRLAGAFDDMAEAMEQRERQLHATLKELWRSWREAQRATEEAELEETKAALFSSVTHDLRAPLTSIKAASTLLIQYDGNLPEDDRADLLETIRESADGLETLITNAVQLSRTRAGGLKPRKAPAAIDEVASRALERLRNRLAEHQVVLVIPEDLPEVPVDIVHLDQALTNLLENAARFSPAGSEIAVSLLPRDGTLLIRVEDHGPGIPAGERDRVFEPFVKLGNGGGAGLGLPISRAIAEAHGGRVIIESPPGGGTAVVMELPLNGSQPKRQNGDGP